VGSLLLKRASAAATLLRDGRVLVAGGDDGAVSRKLSECELYDPVTAQWSATGSLNTARDGHTVTLLPSGQVLAAGGFSVTQPRLKSAELYPGDRPLDLDREHECRTWRP
jgi:hypothetical protein